MFVASFIANKWSLAKTYPGLSEAKPGVGVRAGRLSPHFAALNAGYIFGEKVGG